jgi:hypothetical protein
MASAKIHTSALKAIAPLMALHHGPLSSGRCTLMGVPFGALMRSVIVGGLSLAAGRVVSVFMLNPSQSIARHLMTHQSD